MESKRSVNSKILGGDSKRIKSNWWGKRDEDREGWKIKGK